MLEQSWDRFPCVLYRTVSGSAGKSKSGMAPLNRCLNLVDPIFARLESRIHSKLPFAMSSSSLLLIELYWFGRP